MKRIIFCLIAGLIWAGSFASAEEMPGAMETGHEAMGGGKSKMFGDSRMGGQMFRGMDKATMVASNDGGVIVMMGNKLYKYDKNLNLVKEADIKTDKSGQDGKMCPMCQEKTQKREVYQ